MHRDDDDQEEGERSSRIEVDGWLSLRVPTPALPPLLCLRQRISACFAAKVDFMSSSDLSSFCLEQKPRL
jgi:hypothetical protein